MRRIAVALAPLVFAGAAFAALGEKPGERVSVKPERLPKPYATDAVDNSPRTIPRPANATLAVPKGFKVNLFASNLKGPRYIAIAPNGDVFVTQSYAGSIAVLPDKNADGIADKNSVFADGLAKPHGMLFHDGALFVADTKAVYRITYADGDTKARDRKALTPDGALGDDRGHWTRNIALSADGKSLYIAIGSRGNVGEEEAPRATIQTVPVSGSSPATFASGLRNPIGIALYPGTNDLYTVVNERDGLGDGLVPDYLTRVRKDDFFGWPYAYIGKNADPDFGAKKPDLVAKTKRPDVLFESHSAPIGIAFYTAKQFPERYRGGAFVTLHGSWNSGAPTGYKIVFVPFKNRRPAANAYENFATGFWTEGAETAAVWGRPAGIALARDGALLVADDTGGAIWRISYDGK
jgi:glucose/arabinose dehydrogenase